MYWPVVLIVLMGTPASVAWEEEAPGYATKEECEARLPDALAATKQMKFPVPTELLQFVPGCIDVTPQQFIDTHFQPPPGA